MDPIAPETPPGHRPAKTRTFKMRLSPDDAAKLKSWAHENELSQADFARFMIFARTSYAPPNSSKLEAVARQLVSIATNLNQCQKTINIARASGTLTAAQFEAMHKAVRDGLTAWSEPLDELRSELKKLRPAD
ncbi:plasmid mobilization protein [Ruegeria arenilitoris]|uniref:plasmid mobilization protein n=1 Tax=Ruegeria arenilitoris TaxID=1173585 RepID=UPI00147F7A33|nr:hypothetical protein [Ruegeria arenilitoris]